MLQAGHISPSRSPWAAPIVLSPKKDGSLRFCVDYRKLNANTIRTAYPMPRVDDTLDSLCQAKYISTLDLRSGYWQVELDPDSRDKTAFITHRGLYEFRVMPFGLSNAPATFQCLMDVVLAGLKWQSCLVYIDDIVVFSPTFEQHLRDLSTIFDRLANAGLTLKASKCDFCRKELKYLGHLITPDGIKPDPGLTQAPLLQAPNFNEPFILETDASDYGLGAILTQEFENQKFVIAYASRTQTAAERNYFPTEKEALAIFWATKHFRPYLEGTTIYIRSDCRALQWLLNTKDLSGRLARWAISLSAFNIVDINCHLCQQYKYDNRTLTASLQMHIVHEPWHTIGVDIMGPFPVTQRQKQYLLVVVDYFTRWVELFPLRTTISSHIADILVDEIICRWGCPTYILSDNGPQFVSELFTHICSSLGIQTKNTSNYHPQTNMTERVNRNLKPMIAQYAQENTHSWDRHLSKLALSIRTSINETTGETPAYLNFGRDPKLPIDLLLTEPTQEHNEVRKLQQKTKYDQHSSHRSFKEGHLVWVSIPSPLKHGKLDPQYQGPCRIIQVLSPTSFIIHRLSDGVNLGATNIDRIKPFYSPNMTHTTTQTGINRHQSAAPIQPLMSVNVDNVNNLPTPHIPPNNHSLPLSSTPLPHRYQHPVRIRKQPNRLNL
ncbi:unnamed protein product [Rotaria magnacalcarata]|uniref:Uncharacterized protein n=1 Tax=Rotaria magnacalcarata TaxID=392030 RepID=A0A816EZX2_9BILA|nr:unnamed protein product [Rotaria magnacalcarata]